MNVTQKPLTVVVIVHVSMPDGKGHSLDTLNLRQTDPSPGTPLPDQEYGSVPEVFCSGIMIE